MPASLEVDKHLILVSSDVRIPRVTDDILQRFSLKPARTGCDGLHIVLPSVHGISMRAMRTRCEDELLDVYIRTGNATKSV